MRLLALILLSLPLALPSQNPVWTLSLDSVSLFSSPRATDLNQDGVLDIVVGGGVEGTPISAGVTAIDGASGQILWQRPARNQVFGTAIFGDITGDQVAEVFIGGRNAIFMAINGATGDLVWEFWPDTLPDPSTAGRYQFYNAQWTPDLDADGHQDLLLSNGGDATAVPYDSLRPAGHLMLLSGKTGAVIADEPVPDGHETYFSPLLLDRDGTSDPYVIFGTGGETVRGRLWALRLSALLQGDLTPAQILLDDAAKGMIASPSLADLNGDQVPDLVVPELNARLTALDGATFSTLWSVGLPGYEMYTAPCIGQFTGDASPDVFCIAARGQWSFYADYLQFVVDGATGQVVWSDTASQYQFSQANALDRDGDGWDEVLLIQNRDVGFSTIEYRNQFRWIDVNDNQVQDFGLQRNGLNIYSTPLLADLEGDGDLELVYGFHPPTGIWAGITGAVLERVDLGLNASHVAWPGYMGQDRDGHYHPPVSTSAAQVGAPARVRVYPNPVVEALQVLGEVPLEMVLRDAGGRELLRREQVAQLEVQNLPSGIYLLEMRFRSGVERVKVVKI